MAYRISGGATAVAFFAALASPALADTPVSVSIGPQFSTQSVAQSYGGTQIGFGAAYDVIRAPIVPVQASLAFEYAHGSSGPAALDELSFGADVRLTTPLYVGAGLRVVNTNASAPNYFVPVAVGISYPLAGVGKTSVSSTGIGEVFFIGDRVLSLPGGVNFSLQATYRLIPAYDGINPSSVGAGLRVQL